MKSQRGKDLLLLDGQTYNMKRHDYYPCSIAASHKCKAVLRLDQHGSIKELTREHNHPIMDHLVTDSGRLIRLRKRKTNKTITEQN